MTGGAANFGTTGTGSHTSYTYATTLYQTITKPTGNLNLLGTDRPVAGTVTGVNGVSGFSIYIDASWNVIIDNPTNAYLSFSRYDASGYTIIETGGGASPWNNSSLYGSYNWWTVPGAAGTTVATASTVSSGVINLTWTAASDTGNNAITGYDIFIGSSTTATKSVGVVTSSYVSGLTPGVAYTFRVCAKNVLGQGQRGIGSASVTAPSIAPPIEQVSVDINGEWKSYNGIFSKIAGVWRKVTQGWTKISGVWRQFHGPSFSFIAGGAGTPFINAYPWDNINGFGTKSTNPTTLPTSTVQSVNFSKDGTYLAVAGATSPFINIYPWTQTTSVFGTKLSDPASLPASTQLSIQVSPNQQTIAVSGNSTAGGGGNGTGVAYFYSLSGTTIGTRQTHTYGTSSTASMRGIIWENSNSCVAIAQNYDSVTYPENLRAYAWTSGALGTKYSTASSLTTKDYYSVAFSNNSDTIFAGFQGSSPYLHAWAWSNSTGFGSQYSAPSSAPAGNVNSIRSSKSGNFVALAHSSTPYITIYQWTTGTGFGSKYSDPATLPGGTGYGVYFSIDDYNVALGGTTTPFINAYSWNSGFGTKFSNPVTLPASTVNEVAFS